ncbi:hypothetical protein RhiirA5_423454 [Rhizophagus irregularis]|uniref:Uncharacterized protein n=3 Tax=Rhizophagus irregularis TaxID=588596 RepID=U9TCY6_RHIID|nr:hypothetical protein GLOIN_2v1777314 [Rhizophagus irregularis DAOM 181602=DAOM 197198]EXX60359.1 hypothetical protein RirG_180480 [Rhizophagus irregularis DAOM 197198w]PKC03648.1 hypothetical protein RhiirA5_423454 [Rhizophagus irregularis]PKK72042.1 hypothetical protein RhiirC2_777670 [Rhizophagus irregularis]POG69226.1 hypothetical protein GLOIN_2v1777314 [Rhizophagus irregularis DAOM 181602=DAOM 197198]UZO11714.1 hypothetical protein OCT59_003272 [Rhizophagus irregularis]|eukprot:XP_025176092.1 hypothetical protein GLOIN_2v1777314 [Rhizophagus irregularis DAOM 181602=DAOM 197198]
MGCIDLKDLSEGKIVKIGTISSLAIKIRYFYDYFKSEKFKITESIKDNGSKGVWIVHHEKRILINFMLYQKYEPAESSVNKDQSLQVMLPNKEVVVDADNKFRQGLSYEETPSIQSTKIDDYTILPIKNFLENSDFLVFIPKNSKVFYKLEVINELRESKRGGNC